MSGSNVGKNPTITYQQVNSQKTLIYDLRSELSNLKSEFTRLISKPADLAPKSKVQYKPITKSRYSCLGSETDTESHFSSVSELSALSRTSEFPAKHLLNRSDSNHESKPVPVQQKFNSSNKTYKNFDSASATSKIMWSQQDKTAHQPKRQQSDSLNSTLIRKPHQFASFYKKASDISCEPETTLGMTSRLLNKCQSGHQDQQKIRKLEMENQQKLALVNQSKKKIEALEENITHLKKQMQAMAEDQNRKNDKIIKLEDTVREMTQKVGRSNQQTMEMGREKAKEIEVMRNGHQQELKNQQRDFQKRMMVQKQNQDLKIQNLLKQRDSYDMKLKQAVVDKLKSQEQLKLAIQKCQKQRAQVVQLTKKHQLLELSLREKDLELGSKDTAIRQLQSKRAQLQNELRQTRKNPQCKQIGVNCQQKVQPLQSITQQVNVNANEAKANQSPSPATVNQAQSTAQGQTRSLQDKLTIYLNNIDKQSQKIKQQKAQLDRSQKIIQDCNRAIGEKQSIIRNYGRDCKALEKDLNENKKVRKQLEALLENANLCLMSLNLQKLSSKYIKYEP